MSKEKILIFSDTLQSPTGFGSNTRRIGWALAKKYDVHVLGLQHLGGEQEVSFKIENEERTVTLHPNRPLSGSKPDFGFKSLPRYLDELEPDAILTLNDIHMCGHVPQYIYPQSVKLKVMDLPAKQMRSKYNIQKQLDGVLRKYKEKYPLNTKWIMYCFTPDTKVLTPDGIKYINKIDVGDEVYSWNPNTGNIEISNVINTSKRLYTDDLVKINHQKVDFKVTKEHIFNLNEKELHAGELINMTKGQLRKFPNYNKFNGIKRKWFNMYEYFDDDYIIRIPIDTDINLSDDFKINSAYHMKFYETEYKNIKNDIDKYINIKGIYAKSSVRNQERIPLRIKWTDFLSLAGWYISEGYLDEKENVINNGTIVYKTGRVCLSQMGENNRQKIMDLLNNIGIRYNATETSIRFSGNFYIKLFNEIFHKSTHINKASNKYIPKWIFKYDDLEYLFKSLMDGDGHWNKRKNSIGTYTTSSNQLKDDFITLVTLLGYRAGICKKRDNGCYVITISESEKTPILTNDHISTEKYDDYVYDITLDTNNYFFAGRNDKYVITHNSPQDAIPPMKKWGNIYKTADQVVAFCRFGQKVFKDYYNMDVPYIYHGIDSEVYKPMDSRPDNVKGKFIVGDLNRNQVRKRPVQLIKAFAKFSKDKDDVLLHLQKDWNDPNGFNLKYFVNAYGLNNKMIKPFPRGVNRLIIRNIFNTWDVNMNCSSSEGFGLNIIESAGCGKPTIATDYTSMTELIKEGKPGPRGQLVDGTMIWRQLENAAGQQKVPDVNQMAQAMQKYYDNRQLLDQHGRNARKWVLDNCTMKKLQNDWTELVDKVLSE